MKRTLYKAVSIGLLILIPIVSTAKEDDRKLRMKKYAANLEKQWMEVKSPMSYISDDKTPIREYVAVTGFDQNKIHSGYLTIHYRRDFPKVVRDPFYLDKGFSSAVTTYLLECQIPRKTMIGLTHYDVKGNVISQKFYDKLNKPIEINAFSKPGEVFFYLCSGELFFNLLNQGGFLSAEDQKIFDQYIKDKRAQKTKAIPDKNLTIPKVDFEKYDKLFEKALKNGGY